MLSSLDGLTVIDTHMFIITKSKTAKRIVLTIVAVIFIITASFALWWYGAFLPHYANEPLRGYFATDYEEGRVSFDKHKVKVSYNGEIVWKTKADWHVQDLIIKDIDRDGNEELIMLVWKHGSFGERKPQWVKRNDIRLEQHIFIYQWDSNRETKIKPIWMSSSIGKNVYSIANGVADSIIINENDTPNSWVWQDFGLKIVGRTSNREVKVLCAGDNLIHSTLFDKASDYSELYFGISETINTADIAVVNQETPLVNDPNMISDYPRFGTPVEIGEGLVKAGFDVINLANNHMLDKGLTGLESTLDFFNNEEDIFVVGAHLSEADNYTDSIKIVEKNGIRCAFVGYTFNTNGMPQPQNKPNAIELLSDEERIGKQVEYAKARADFVIVLAHWGEEYSNQLNEEQMKMTEFMYDLGVDVIVGSHPHVLQKYELYKDKMLVYYSLGNLISGQNTEKQLARGTGEGGLAEIIITKDDTGRAQIDSYELIKIKSIYPIGIIE